MSWSTEAVGKPDAVARKIAADISNIKCQGPEEAIKNEISDVIGLALGDFPPGAVVRVRASGSQSYVDYHDHTKGRHHTLNVSIEPIWGFVE